MSDHCPRVGMINRVLYGVFFASGFAAVIYQIIWQRVLLSMYGANVEAVTVVVTAFMLGLGLGSLGGGRLAGRTSIRLPVLFAMLELGIGAWGLVSLPLFQWVGARTVAASTLVTNLSILSLLLIPTALMGATLPVLVAYAVSRATTVGRAVGGLYSTNTLGSAAGAFVAVIVVFGALGQRQSVWLAATLNFLVAGAVLLWPREPGREA